MFRKNTASQFIHFQGVDSTTGGIKSGVTWTIRRCIDGTFAAATGTVTEDGTTGWYKLAMSQADTNGNNIGFNFTGTGAVPQTVNIITDGSPPDVNLKNAAGTAVTLDANNVLNVSTKYLAGTALTARDIGASVLLSSGTGTGQVKLSSGYVAPNWGDVGNPTTAVDLSGTTIKTTQKVDVDTIKTNPVVNAGTITFPTTATLASTTNITAGTITTTTNLTNAATNGDFTATMKTSVQTAADAAITANSLVLEIEAETDGIAAIPTGDAYAALVTTTYAEPSSVPAATATLKDKIGWLCSLARNKLTQTATTQLLRNDTDAATIGTSTVSDDGTTFTRGKFT